VEQAPSVRWALASLSLAMLLSSLGTSIANVALPNLAQAFNASFQEVQWIVLAYLLAITTLIVSVGRLGDITGRKRLLLAGIFLFTVASSPVRRRSHALAADCCPGGCRALARPS
jgi:MFS family permease